MKTIILFICIIYNLTVIAQDCKSYFYLQNDKTIEMTIYDKKGDESGKQVYHVSDFKGDASSATANVSSEMFDKKGKSIVQSTNSIKCENGIMKMDLKMNMPQTQAEAFGATTAKAESVYVEYPSGLTVGDNLKDATMEMDIDNKGIKQSISMSVTNRKVDRKETVTTTAGTWDCFVITNQTKMRIKTMGIGVPMNMDVTEWYAPGFGVVKTKSKFGETAITAIK